jgi:serine/threonine protein kinase
VVRGNDLFMELSQKRVFQEQHCAIIARSLLQGIGYCHSKGIMHRNIMAENIISEINLDHPMKPVTGGKIKSFREAIQVKDEKVELETEEDHNE